MEKSVLYGNGPVHYFMHTIWTKVVPDNLKACPKFVWRSNKLMYAKWIPSIEIG